ncbi:MAG: hypothetical protein K0Q73_1789 [Paenibacillus sp.]|jgi:hypothetical protein|nr:hypothetical protein [Paenibacillus sp.]
MGDAFLCAKGLEIRPNADDFTRFFEVMPDIDRMTSSSLIRNYSAELRSAYNS